jgi:dTMP kinase
MFLTFEGLDFSGKTTQARKLADRLSRRQKVVTLREPGGTRISERLRELLLDKQHLELCDAAELFLFSASRAQLVTEVIRPALERGDIVICDRYVDSTTAYQGYGRGLNLEAIRQINTLATRGTDPDLTIVVDIPVDEIERRRQATGQPFDRMESSGRLFYERVRAGFRALAVDFPERVVCVDGIRSIDDVHQEIWTLLIKKGCIQQ